jgi:hypothetical protein
MVKILWPGAGNFRPSKYTVGLRKLAIGNQILFNWVSPVGSAGVKLFTIFRFRNPLAFATFALSKKFKKS